MGDRAAALQFLAKGEEAARAGKPFHQFSISNILEQETVQ